MFVYCWVWDRITQDEMSFHVTSRHMVDMYMMTVDASHKTTKRQQCASVWLCDRVKLMCQKHNRPPASGPRRQHSGLSPAALDWLHKDPPPTSQTMCVFVWLHSYLRASRPKRSLYAALLLCGELFGATTHLWHPEQNPQRASCRNWREPIKRAMGGKHNQRQHVSNLNPSSRHNWKYKQFSKHLKCDLLCLFCWQNLWSHWKKYPTGFEQAAVAERRLPAVTSLLFFFVYISQLVFASACCECIRGGRLDSSTPKYTQLCVWFSLWLKIISGFQEKRDKQY